MSRHFKNFLRPALLKDLDTFLYTQFGDCAEILIVMAEDTNAYTALMLMDDIVGKKTRPAQLWPEN